MAGDPTPLTGVAMGELTTISVGSAIGKVISIEHSGVKAEKIDKTVLGDLVKKSRNSTALDAGEVTITAQFDSSSLGNISAIVSGTETSCVITFMDGPATVDTMTWSKAVLNSWKVSNIKANGNVEYELGMYFNDLPT